MCDVLRTWFKTRHSNCYERKNCESSWHKFLLNVFSWKDKGGNIFHTCEVSTDIGFKFLLELINVWLAPSRLNLPLTPSWTLQEKHIVRFLLGCLCIHFEGFWFDVLYPRISGCNRRQHERSHPEWHRRALPLDKGIWATIIVRYQLASTNINNCEITT